MFLILISRLQPISKLVSIQNQKSAPSLQTLAATAIVLLLSPHPAPTTPAPTRPLAFTTVSLLQTTTPTQHFRLLQVLPIHGTNAVPYLVPGQTKLATTQTVTPTRPSRRPQLSKTENRAQTATASQTGV